MPPKVNNNRNSKNSNTNNKSYVKLWKYIVLVILLGLIGATLWVINNPEQVRDFYILATYKPPKAIIDLANEDTMTNYAKQLFYVNEPKIQSKLDFAKSCPNGLNYDYVIGCYHAGDRGIYLLNVQSSELKGIIQVTAAYEMLHAGYARLSNHKTAELDKLMWAFYQSHIKSTAIRKQMSAYLATEPGAQYDELYSVLGTEVAQLPTNLASQYNQYFFNRSKIVAMYNNYQAAFTNRNSQISSDEATLKDLKSNISNNESQLNQIQLNINSDKINLDSEKASNNIVDYNNSITEYNNLVNSYNDLLIVTKNEISKYNTVVKEVNLLVLQEQQLIKSIDSSAIVPTTNLK